MILDVHLELHNLKEDYLRHLKGVETRDEMPKLRNQQGDSIVQTTNISALTLNQLK